ncbi:hypothetical protein BKA62DRAFT_683876 [Auriculariales sp. MPI-PUGE-AT-0066]|nr:hypothetical protein BKA62DRAFT_683876 [Auriculariales sp. MPI-PUGE-AT-0066]
MADRFSPPLSAPSSVAASRVGGLAPPRIVTQVVIEGAAKRGEDGVRVRMYLKMQLAPDQISMPLIPLFSGMPWSTPPLCSRYSTNHLGFGHSVNALALVHPTDKRFVPYAGGPRSNKLLKHASRALGLPAESTQSYADLCSPSTSTTGRPPASANATSSTSPLDLTYTGSISISNFSESDDVRGRNVLQSGSRIRRQSMGQRARYCYMAGLEVFIPYLTVPPADPYLLSIPCPRCLDNKLKLKLFDIDAQGSFDDLQRWDVSTVPVVSQKTQAWRNSLSQGHAADYDSETSDVGVTNDGEFSVIQGNFYSTERLRLRWAVPDPRPPPPDGWNHVNWEQADARLAIRILKVFWHSQRPGVCTGLRLQLDYSVTCIGVHFPGVAALLAMDFHLDPKQQHLAWAADDSSSSRWEITGGAGLHGVDTGDTSSRDGVASRRTSSSSFGSSSVPDSPPPGTRSLQQPSHIPVPTTQSSLLNVPLPVDPVTDYSFEGRSPNELTTPSRASLSGMSSASGVSQLTSASDRDELARRLPVSVPTSRVSLQLDLDHILPKSRYERGTFTFTVQGDVDLTAVQDDVAAGDPDLLDAAIFDLPVFQLHDVGDERVSVSVVSAVAEPILLAAPRSDMSSSGSILPRTPRRQGQADPPKLLQKDKTYICGEDSRLIIRPPILPPTPTTQSKAMPDVLGLDRESRLQMPTLEVAGHSTVPAHSISSQQSQGLPTSSDSYTVMATLPAAAILQDRLHFSIAIADAKQTLVQLVYATLGGRPLKAATHINREPEDGAFSTISECDVIWISLTLGPPPHATSDIEVLFLVRSLKTNGDSQSWWRANSSKYRVQILPLPALTTQVSFWRAEYRDTTEAAGQLLCDGWDHVVSRSGSTLLTKVNAPKGFAPTVNVSSRKPRRPSNTWLSIMQTMSAALVLAIIAMAIGSFYTEPRVEASRDLPSFPTQTISATEGIEPQMEAPLPNISSDQTSHTSIDTGPSALSVTEQVPNDLVRLIKTLTSNTLTTMIHQLLLSLRRWGTVAISWPLEPRDGEVSPPVP